jgi:hypothetical protein
LQTTFETQNTNIENLNKNIYNEQIKNNNLINELNKTIEDEKSKLNK